MHNDGNENPLLYRTIMRPDFTDTLGREALNRKP